MRVGEEVTDTPVVVVVVVGEDDVGILERPVVWIGEDEAWTKVVGELLLANVEEDEYPDGGIKLLVLGDWNIDETLANVADDKAEDRGIGVAVVCTMVERKGELLDTLDTGVETVAMDMEPTTLMLKLMVV